MLAAAVVLGVVAGFVHGNDAGLGRTVGNISTPWLLIALLPGWRARSALKGAAVGVAATVVALVGFYVALTFTMRGHLGNENGRSLLHLIWFVTTSNKIWFEAGLVSGPVFGAIGGWLGRTGRRKSLVMLAAALLVVEPGLMFFGSAILGAAGQAAPDERRPYLVEALIGAVVAACALRLPRRDRNAGS